MDQREREIESAELSIWFFCGVLMLAYGVVLGLTYMWLRPQPYQS